MEIRTSRKLHRIIGLLMLLPMIGWVTTGMVFFIKPGYESAYEIPVIATYPLDQNLSVEAEPDWLEIRLLNTILGDHLLVTTAAGTQHLNPRTLEALPPPAKEELRLLFEDVISGNRARYGSVVSIENTTARTTTGVVLELDWGRLRLSQRGEDTELIDLLYKVHYLQWTPWSGVNQVLGFGGLFLLVVLAVLGTRIYVSNRPSARMKKHQQRDAR